MHFYQNFNLSENLTNFSENGEQGTKVKAIEVEVWNQKKISFLYVYASNLSYVFMDEMNLLYYNIVYRLWLELCAKSLTAFNKL